MKLNQITITFSLVDGKNNLFIPCSPRNALENPMQYHVSLNLDKIIFGYLSLAQIYFTIKMANSIILYVHKHACNYIYF